ncbi:hypothetical protein Chor_008759 [Crotalus horridus]
MERLAATEELVDLRDKIRDAQRQDPFMAARCHELAGDEGDKTPWMYTDDLHPVPAMDKFLQELAAVHQVIQHHLQKAKEDYK